MLAKKHRLLIQEFLGQRAEIKKSPYFTLKIFIPGRPYSRFGLVISKKVAAKATERNRLKRLLFAALAAELVATRPPRDVLIILQPAISKLANKDAIIEELYKLL